MQRSTTAAAFALTVGSLLLADAKNAPRHLPSDAFDITLSMHASATSLRNPVKSAKRFSRTGATRFSSGSMTRPIPSHMSEMVRMAFFATADLRLSTAFKTERNTEWTWPSNSWPWCSASRRTEFKVWKISGHSSVPTLESMICSSCCGLGDGRMSSVSMYSCVSARRELLLCSIPSNWMFVLASVAQVFVSKLSVTLFFFTLFPGLLLTLRTGDAGAGASTSKPLCFMRIFCLCCSFLALSCLLLVARLIFGELSEPDRVPVELS
mmetsp:Transcript_10854/g.22014  ORF Transcript_10854/g.22014 Transcript_10854/m.22014 type:complete len:266 (-) Transcript_10854:605-1402(-)